MLHLPALGIFPRRAVAPRQLPPPKSKPAAPSTAARRGEETPKLPTFWDGFCTTLTAKFFGCVWGMWKRQMHGQLHVIGLVRNAVQGLWRDDASVCV